jgi:hypothetical protein
MRTRPSGLKFQIETLPRTIIKQAGLTVDEFVDLL